MNNTKPKDNVVKIGHNSNRSISQETLEKMANRFMHILEYVNNNLETLEKDIGKHLLNIPMHQNMTITEDIKNFVSMKYMSKRLMQIIN